MPEHAPPVPLSREDLRAELVEFAENELRALFISEVQKLRSSAPVWTLQHTDMVGGFGGDPEVDANTAGNDDAPSTPAIGSTPLSHPSIDRDVSAQISLDVSRQASIMSAADRRLNVRDELAALAQLESESHSNLVARMQREAKREFRRISDFVDHKCKLRFIEAVENSPCFQAASAALIVGNAYVMALGADYQINHAGTEASEYDYYGTLELVFVAAYTLELLIHLAAQRVRFFASGWNWFDIGIVGTGLVEAGLSFNDSNSGGGERLVQFRVMRILKMLKVMRVVRLMRVLREVRMLLDSLMGSMRPLMWTILLIAAIIFMFSIMFVNSVAGYMHEQAQVGYIGMDASDRQLLLDSWGSIAQSMYTLFSCATGGEDWRAVATLLPHIGGYIFVVFIFYIIVFVFVVTNSVCAIFVEAAAEYAKKDQSRMMQEQLAMKNDYMGMILQIYREMDSDGDGRVTKEEFLRFKGHPRMVEFAYALEIGELDLEQFFDVMSLRGTKTVDLEGFVEGCIRLRGNARSMDVIEVSLQQVIIFQEVLRINLIMQILCASMGVEVPTVKTTPEMQESPSFSHGMASVAASMSHSMASLSQGLAASMSNSLNPSRPSRQNMAEVYARSPAVSSVSDMTTAPVPDVQQGTAPRCASPPPASHSMAPMPQGMAASVPHGVADFSRDDTGQWCCGNSPVFPERSSPGRSLHTARPREVPAQAQATPQVAPQLVAPPQVTPRPGARRMEI